MEQSLKTNKKREKKLRIIERAMEIIEPMFKTSLKKNRKNWRWAGYLARKYGRSRLGDVQLNSERMKVSPGNGNIEQTLVEH